MAVVVGVFAQVVPAGVVVQQGGQVQGELEDAVAGVGREQAHSSWAVQSTRQRTRSTQCWLLRWAAVAMRCWWSAGSRASAASVRSLPYYQTLTNSAEVLGLPTAYFYAEDDRLARLIAEFKTKNQL